MNTALQMFKVGWFGNHWVITSGDQTYMTRSIGELGRILRGKGADPKPEPLPGQSPKAETMEEFLARGGKVTRITPTELAFPPALPHHQVHRPSPGRITLESLGFRQPVAAAQAGPMAITLDVEPVTIPDQAFVPTTSTSVLETQTTEPHNYVQSNQD